MTIKFIDLSEFQHLLHGGAGLIIGPEQTLQTTCLQTICESIKAAYSITQNSDYITLSTIALQNGTLPTEIRSLIEQTLNKMKPSTSLNNLAKIRWSAV